MTVILDCTELIQNPIRTGIQRVVRELIRNWPDDGPRLHIAHFVRGSAKGLVAVPQSVVDLLADRDPRACVLNSRQLGSLIANMIEGSAKIELPDRGMIFVPELFYDEHRSSCYQWLATFRRNDLAILCFDFLPFLSPNLFSLKTSAHLMHYISALQCFPHVAHISESTRYDFENRIMRGRAPADGVVLPLGANGINVERQSWRHDRKGFLTIGSIDGRKNQQAVVAAFAALRSRGYDVELTVIGRAFENQDTAWLRNADQIPGFLWISDASDAIIADAYRKTRATIYVSQAEGYGLPPVESLSVGVPVIVPASMPSTMCLPLVGHIRLDHVSVDTIADAMMEIMRSDVAESLWEGTRDLKIATWQDFGRAASKWLGEHINGVHSLHR